MLALNQTQTKWNIKNDCYRLKLCFKFDLQQATTFKLLFIFFHVKTLIFYMKTKTSHFHDVKSSLLPPQRSCIICQQIYSKRRNNSLFQKNYQLIALKINQEMSKTNFLSTIQKIVQKQPSKQSIVFWQIEKSLIFQEHFKQYYNFDKIPQKIGQLIHKHMPNVKTNYMDFKIKNFLILNRYRVFQKVNLPFPLNGKFQKLTDSKMSSTKSVQYKVLQQLQKQSQQKGKCKSSNMKKSNKCQTKKLPHSHSSKGNFKIQALTQSIRQMIQNIRDNRALQKFKKQMESGSKLNCGICRLDKQQIYQKITHKENSSMSYFPQKQAKHKCVREKQHMQNFLKDMVKHFPQKIQKQKGSSIKKLFEFRGKQLNGLQINKKESKQINSHKQAQKSHKNYQNQIQQYGLSIIRQKRKQKQSIGKERSKRGKLSVKSKQNGQTHQLDMSKHLQTQYSNYSTQRLHTGESILLKSKASSRIQTQYDCTVIVRYKKQKNKYKPHEDSLLQSFNKNSSKSNTISEQDCQSFNKKTKTKSKSKLSSFRFKSSSKRLPK